MLVNRAVCPEQYNILNLFKVNLNFKAEPEPSSNRTENAAEHITNKLVLRFNTMKHHQNTVIAYKAVN
jgi:hypothetical protein